MLLNLKQIGQIALPVSGLPDILYQRY